MSTIPLLRRVIAHTSIHIKPIISTSTSSILKSGGISINGNQISGNSNSTSSTSSSSTCSTNNNNS